LLDLNIGLGLPSRSKTNVNTGAGAGGVGRKEIEPKSTSATATSRSSVAVPNRLGPLPSRSALPHDSRTRIVDNKAIGSKIAENVRNNGDRNASDVFYESTSQSRGQEEGQRRKEVFEAKAESGQLRKMISRGQLGHGVDDEQDGPMEGMHHFSSVVY
jgi:hypothetical protein